MQIANPLQFLGEAFGDRTSTSPRRSSSASASVIQPSILLTTLWIVGMINCINWIDGLDGLSTGRLAHRGPDPGRHLHHVASPWSPLVALLCAVLAGSLAGFLPWNFHPARVFIGTPG